MKNKQEVEEVKVKVNPDTLVITIPRVKDENGKVIMPPSKKSGKSLIVATTRGNRPTMASVGGKPLIVGVNAYISKD